MRQLEDGTIIQIGDKQFALQAWDSQLCEQETVYSGYTEEEWRSTLEAVAIVKELEEDGQWLWTTAPYQPRFHDEGGLRVVGEWHGGEFLVIGSAYDLWEEE